MDVRTDRASRGTSDWVRLNGEENRIMTDDMKDIGAWIEEENPFVVTVHLRLQGFLTNEEVKDAMMMRRTEWVAYVREKAGLAPDAKNKETT